MEKFNQYHASQLRSFYDEAWERLANYPMSEDDDYRTSKEDGRSTMSNIKKFDMKKLMEENWNPEFDKVLIDYDKELLQMMRNRLCLGSLRYGKIGNKEKASKQDRREYIRRKFKLCFYYKNLEPLIDISNVLLLESIENNHSNLRCDYEEMINHLNFQSSFNALQSIKIYNFIKKERCMINYNQVIFKLCHDYYRFYVEIKDFCLIYEPSIILFLYDEFLSSGNSAYLGLAIHMCHLYYYLSKECTNFELKAKDDDEHILVK